MEKVASTPLARARAAYVWTVTKVGYRMDGHRSAEVALADLTGDCDAHAAIYAALCQAMGIECTIVVGAVRVAVDPDARAASCAKPLSPGQWLVAHSWNAVRIDGRWGLVDTAMGSRDPLDPTEPDDYFLVAPAVLASDHVPKDAAMRLIAADADLSRVPIVRPLAWRMGIEEGLETGDVQDHAQIVLRPRLAWRRDLRAALQTRSGSEPDRILVQPSERGIELLSCPSGPSVAWLGIQDGADWRPIVGYPMRGSGTGSLPKVMRRFYDSGASLEAPLDRSLASNATTEIRLRAPGASHVVAFQGADVAGTFVREGETWTLNAAPVSGTKLEVMASYDDPHRFQGLLTYDVR